jgi:hypothetical protein
MGIDDSRWVPVAAIRCLCFGVARWQDTGKAALIRPSGTFSRKREKDSTPQLSLAI